AARRTRITYETSDRLRRAEVRLRTTDPAAVAAIHAFPGVSTHSPSCRWPRGDAQWRSLSGAGELARRPYCCGYATLALGPASPHASWSMPSSTTRPRGALR